MNIDQVKTIAILGAGNMGHQMATLCAMQGYKTFCTDPSETQLKKAEEFVKSYLPGRVAKERITQAEADKAASLLHFTADFEEAVKDADVVIEAVSENEDLKRDIFTQLDALCKADAVLTTNSSRMPSSKFADCVKNPARLCNMHFFNPALVMKCVEVMRGEHTSDETFELIVELSRRLNKVPTRINREIRGLVVNRILASIKQEAYFLMESGYASFEDIDNAVCNALGHPMGPFQTNDLTGIDLTYHIDMERFQQTGNKEDLPWPSVVEKYFKGEWGQKTGKGFYEYPDKKKN